MGEESYGIDCLIVYSWDFWENRVNTGKPILVEDYKYDEKNKAAQTPLSIKDSGPEEFIQTRTTGPHPPPSVSGSIELSMIEICPRCQETLQLYYTKDVLTHEKVMRCKNCFTILVQSSNGWVEKT
jgi:hypothetical protein